VVSVTTSVEQRVHEALSQVVDPEIPVCKITDLGLVERVEVFQDVIEVDLVPTFAGCPALDVIRIDVERAIAPVAEGRTVRVRFVLDPPWTTTRINETAREAMKEYGLAPPGARLLKIAVPCPYCGSLDTTIESEFGPTLCRSVRYCNACRNPFEGFKPKGV
jgi:ring-1,2-phenylacetyl-CoA epoxidase subunit PaaD